MDLVLCHAVLYRRVPDSWVCNCHAASKTQTCLSCFPPCEQQGQKYTAMSERNTKSTVCTVRRKSSGFLNILGIFHPKWLIFLHFHYMFGHAMFHSYFQSCIRVHFSGIMYTTVCQESEILHVKAENLHEKTYNIYAWGPNFSHFGS